MLVHLLPGRGWLSDPLFDGGAEAASQAAAGLEIAAASALGLAGWAALQAGGGLASVASKPDGPPVAWGRVLTHPLVLAMALGDAVVLVLSFADR